MAAFLIKLFKFKLSLEIAENFSFLLKEGIYSVKYNIDLKVTK